MTKRIASPDLYKRGPYNAARGEFANVRMANGKVEQIPWDWMDGNVPPIKVSRRKATFCDGPGVLKALEALIARKVDAS